MMGSDGESPTYQPGIHESRGTEVWQRTIARGRERALKQQARQRSG